MTIFSILDSKLTPSKNSLSPNEVTKSKKNPCSKSPLNLRFPNKFSKPHKIREPLEITADKKDFYNDSCAVASSQVDTSTFDTYNANIFY